MGLHPGASNPTLQRTMVEIRGDTAIYRSFFHNGGVRSEITLVSGLAEGPLAIRYPDGAKHLEWRYKAGSIDGEYIRYHRNGQRAEIKVYLRDTSQVDCKVEFDTLGRQVSEWISAGGDPGTGTYLVRNNGRVTDSTRYIRGLEEGRSFSLNSKEDTVAKGLYHSGRRDDAQANWNAPPGTYRTTADLLKVLRKRTPNLRHRYNEYLRTSRFNAKVTLYFGIEPDGTIGYLFPVRDTSARPRFVRDILNEIQGWKFDPVKSERMDLVTVPFTFSE